MTQIALRCRCGTLHGVATDLFPETGSRIVCLCDDCQAFARFLGRDDVLDRYGGSDIFQMTPAQLVITGGAEQLRCVRLSEKGMLRWYAGCCNTPVGNTMSAPRLPFVGVLAAFMDHAGDGRSRDEVLGPVLMHIHGRFAIGGQPAHAHRTAPFSLITRSVRLLFRAWLAGKHRPSPFFDAATGQPTVTPQVLTGEQRKSLAPAPG